MLDLTEINATIQELEQEKPTYDTCQKLATLYSVRDHNSGSSNCAALPSYGAYCSDKRRCQLGQLSEAVVLEDLRFVCSEILLLIQNLYSSTSCKQEQEQILSTIQQLQTKYL